MNARKDIKKLISTGLVITPKVTGWLLNGNEVNWHDPEVAAKMLPLVTQKADRVQAAWHPSSLHSCPRAQVFSYLGVPANGRTIGTSLANLFQDGHWRHLRWQTMLLQTGLIDQVEIPIEVPKARFVGHADGGKSGEYLIEIKGIYSLRNLHQPLEHHLWQAHGYFFGDPEGREKIVFIYEDKQTQDWQEFVVYKDDDLMRDITSVIYKLNESVDERKLPRAKAACRAKEGKEFQQCGYQGICHQLKSFSQAELAGVQARGGSAAAPGTRVRTPKLRRRIARQGGSADRRGRG